MNKKISIILVFLWMIVIFMFSNQPSDTSSKYSNGFTRNLVVFINKLQNKTLSEKELNLKIDKYHIVIRKLAHLTEYLILGILVMNLLINYNIELKRLLLISLIICILYACSDEIHQLFIKGRSGQPLDVLIDTIGSTLGIAIYYIINKKKLKLRT